VPGVNVSGLCRKLGMSRQNYYARRKAAQPAGGGLRVGGGFGSRERQLQPRLGTRKIHHRLKGELVQAGVRIGRDRF